jgi:hypothetical protein
MDSVEIGRNPTATPVKTSFLGRQGRFYPVNSYGYRRVRLHVKRARPLATRSAAGRLAGGAGGRRPAERTGRFLRGTYRKSARSGPLKVERAARKA